jgi:aryl-alcohol dehydrogenase-like predicted oxidoreductase
MRHVEPGPSPVPAHEMHRYDQLRYRAFDERAACTVGLGPCKERGDEDPRAMARAVALGCNVLDTAPHVHRGGHERCVGEAVRIALASGICERDWLVVNTTVGWVPDLIENNIRTHGFARLRALVEERYIAPGVFSWPDLAHAGHVVAPNYIRHSVEQSLARMGLDRVDCVFLDSPHRQRAAVSPAEYRRRMLAAFAALEQLCARGLARCYGISSPVALDLDELVAMAAEVAGAGHRLRAVRAPFSLLRPDMRPLVDAAARLGLYVFAAGCLDGGAPRYELPDELAPHFGHEPDPVAAIRWVQSSPGVGTALFGSRDARHIQANLAAAARPPLDPAVYLGGAS